MMFKIHILNMKKMVEMAILMVRHQEPMLVEYSKIVIINYLQLIVRVTQLLTGNLMSIIK